ncbi:hypothetical protein BDV95DRAFT_678387 [Massariosphaeria phaeospora]|uniref:NADH:flavin oxidoreductase/NADH oxidase N-terminal domain-containing protein n=1 Tax=Massariosphaeria phaeospora TaxID=100035 RepID=A0A7C8IAY9_9PLEO|nr:hypothetical protein BDV95DRAFT_678387 [Massariosphaeria phaeospora]
MAAILASPLQTPSGLVFRNRLVKAAMAETMSEDGMPNEKHIQAYATWGTGGWGGLLTGNVDVSTVYKGSNQNVTVPGKIPPAMRDAWAQWALATQKEGAAGIVQLVHPGRQSFAKTGDRGFFEKAIGPSAVPLRLGDGIFDRVLGMILFGTPKEMTLQDIDLVVQQFAAAAKHAHEAGFKGVEIHGAHGYIITQFLSPKSNLRQDAYGGTVAKRAQLAIDVIRAIRNAVPASFCVGIKLNSADVGGNESLEDSLEQVRLIAQEQVDFLEISGGTFENLRTAKGDDTKATSTAKREAFFLDYAREVRARFPDVILMVTGGFRSRRGMVAALESGACDLVGLGRPAIVFPHLPRDVLLNEAVGDQDAVVDLADVPPPWFLKSSKVVTAGAGSLYYVSQIKAIAAGQTPKAPPKV